MRQIIGEDEVGKEDGIKETTKEGWPKEQEAQTMLVSTVDK